VAVVPTAHLEDTMASKDKGGRSAKKTASRNLKEKRQDKKTKKDAAEREAKHKGT
jgi:hypothetical protein